MNFRFGQLLGKSSIDGMIYGFASLCGDGLKTVLPFVIAANWRAARYLTALAALLLLLILAAYSLASSLGFAAINRSEVAGAKQLEMDRYQALKERLAAKRAEYHHLPAHRPLATVDGELQAAKRHLRWTTTKACTDVTLPESRVHCAHYFTLTAERGAAERAATLNQEIKALAEQMSDFGQTAAGAHADPQVQILQQIANASEDRIKLALNLLISLFVELGSSLGLYLSTSLRLNSRRRTEARDRQCELFDGCDHDLIEGVQLPLSTESIAMELYPRYLQWCSDRAHRYPFTLSEFFRRLNCAPVVGHPRQRQRREPQ